MTKSIAQPLTLTTGKIPTRKELFETLTFKSEKKLFLQLENYSNDKLILGENIKEIAFITEFSYDAIRHGLISFEKKGWIKNLGRGVYQKNGDLAAIKSK